MAWFVERSFQPSSFSEVLVRKSIVSDDGSFQWDVDAPPLPTKYLLGAEVQRFRDHAFQFDFLAVRGSKMATKKFDSETAPGNKGDSLLKSTAKVLLTASVSNSNLRC
jgi:hypothetical protein